MTPHMSLSEATMLYFTQNCAHNLPSNFNVNSFRRQNTRERKLQLNLKIIQPRHVS